MKPQKPEWTVPVPVCLKSLHQPTSITTHTIVMQWGTQFHIGFIYHYNLIHLTSIGDAAALLWSNGHCHMILRGGDGSEETFIHRRCLQLARWWLEYNSLWWEGRFRPTSVFVLIFFSQIEPRIVPLQKECINRNCFSSHRLSINHLIGWRRGKDFWL